MVTSWWLKYNSVLFFRPYFTLFLLKYTVACIRVCVRNWEVMIYLLLTYIGSKQQWLMRYAIFCLNHDEIKCTLYISILINKWLKLSRWNVSKKHHLHTKMQMLMIESNTMFKGSTILNLRPFLVSSFSDLLLKYEVYTSIPIVLHGTRSC